MAERYAESIKEKFKSKKVGQLVSPGELDGALRRYGAPLTLPHWFAGHNEPLDPDQWRTVMEEVLASFEQNDRVQFESEQLQQVAEQMWRQIPRHKKLAVGLTPLAATLAAFGSILMLPLDFGTSILANASIVELLAAAGLTAFSTYWAGGKHAQALSTQAAVEQMSTFYVLLCHRLGVDPGEPLPSVHVRQQTIAFPTPRLTVSAMRPAGPTLIEFRVRDVFRRELSGMLPRKRS
jgi:hypothetical protein